MTEEIFKDIPWYNGWYKVSNLGKVKSIKKMNWTNERILKSAKDWHWYPAVALFKNWKSKTYKIHKLMYLTFMDTSNKKLEVNHKNWIKTDNTLQNLELVTHSENNKHTFDVLWYKWSMLWKSWKLCIFSKPVIQYDLKWNILKIWECAADIKRELWFLTSSITKVCRGQWKTAYGYTWKYKLQEIKNSPLLIK